jgi:hypothetical protein
VTSCAARRTADIRSADTPIEGLVAEVDVISLVGPCTALAGAALAWPMLGRLRSSTYWSNSAGHESRGPQRWVRYASM